MELINIFTSKSLTCNKVWFFFTFWSLLLVIAAPLIYKNVDLLFLSMYVCIVGTGIFFVNPGYVKTFTCDGKKMVFLGGFDKAVLNTLFHVVPFIFIFVRYGDYYLKNKYSHATAMACLLILTYVITVAWENVYDLKPVWSIVYFVVFYGCYQGLRPK